MNNFYDSIFNTDRLSLQHSFDLKRVRGGNALRKLFLVLGIFIMVLGLVGFQWPVESKQLTATFGGNRFRAFFPGIEISNSNDTSGEVQAVAPGEIVYYDRGDSGFSTLPSGLGSFLVVRHDGGLQSVYAHLEEESIDVEQFAVDTTSRIGKIGDTGFAYGKSLFFSLFDQELNQLINPLLILPPVEDAKPPLIKNVMLKMENKEVLLESPEDLSAGRGELVATIYDQSEQIEYYSPMAPFAVALYINGEEKMGVEFEGLQEKEGVVTLLSEPKLTYSDYYISEWTISFGTIDINPGTTSIELIARDIYENESSSTYTLTVRSE